MFRSALLLVVFASSCKGEPASAPPQTTSFSEQRPTTAPGDARAVTIDAVATAEGPSRTADHELAWYRAVLTATDRNEVAFLVGLPKSETGQQAVVITGLERAVARVERSGRTIRVSFPIYGAQVEFQPAEGGYVGRYQITSVWGNGEMPMRAAPIAGPDVAALATLASGTPIDLGESRSIWKLKGGGYTIKLVLDQRAPGVIVGTMLFDNGNVAYFGGSARGSRILLAGFEGRPFSLDLTLDKSRKRVTGTWRAGHLLAWKEAMAGDRVADFQLGLTIGLKEPNTMLRHPQLADFENKPLIVELAATWCSTCKNAAPTLRALYKEHHPSGLEMVSLLYEFTKDPEVNAKAEVLFRETHETQWPARAVPGEQEDFFDILPEGLVNVDVGGFPAVIFRRRDGTIAGIHSGFPNENTGAAHDATVAKFRRLAAEIVKQ